MTSTHVQRAVLCSLYKDPLKDQHSFGRIHQYAGITRLFGKPWKLLWNLPSNYLQILTYCYLEIALSAHCALQQSHGPCPEDFTSLRSWSNTFLNLWESLPWLQCGLDQILKQRFVRLSEGSPSTLTDLVSSQRAHGWALLCNNAD